MCKIDYIYSVENKLSGTFLTASHLISSFDHFTPTHCDSFYYHLFFFFSTEKTKTYKVNFPHILGLCDSI